MRRMHRLPLVAVLCLVAALCLIAAACAGPVPSGHTAARTLDQGTATPLPTVDPSRAADVMLAGPWRRNPIRPSPAVADAAERACRALEGLATLPLRVMDARGAAFLALVFADASTARVCLVDVAADGSATAEARVLLGMADVPAPSEGHLGAHAIEIVGAPSGPKDVVVGRVADVPQVGISFDDATWGKATLADGWYVAWWPQSALALTVASVDRRSVVIDSYPVVN